jgi:transposase
VGCFAHARRKFFEAQKGGSRAKPAATGVQYIKGLYDIDSELRKQLTEKKLDEKGFLTQRQECSAVLLEKFRKYLEKQKGEVPEDTLLGKAVSYTLHQWDKLAACLECAELTPDNNISENAIRPFVARRKNRLFYKCPAGAETACILYSVIETAKLNGLNPLKYQQALFERIPYAVSPDDWVALLPWNISRSSKGIIGGYHVPDGWGHVPDGWGHVPDGWRYVPDGWRYVPDGLERFPKCFR